MGIIRSIKFRLDWWVRRMDRVGREWLATVNESPVLVLGNQKSGTTAIAVLLAERTGQSVTWDLSIGHDALLTDIHGGTAPIDDLVDEEVLAFSHDVIKDPNLTLLFEPLKERFPQARFAMIVRDPRDNIRSILDRLDLPGDRTQLTGEERASLPEGWRRVINGDDFGVVGDTYIDRLAERWTRMARTYLDNASDFALIRYEDFLDGKVSAIDSLASRLGLPIENPIQDQVDRQFQPRGQRRDVDWLSIYGERNLERIERRCGKAMQALGYTNFRVIEALSEIPSS
jgi:hypothetical protein